MFLSDELQNIYEESGCFDCKTSAKIVVAINNRVSKDLNRLTGSASQRGGVKVSVVVATINNVKNAFNNFAKQHPDIPDVLLDLVNANFNKYHQFVYNACHK